MAQEREWMKWRDQELRIFNETISWVKNVITTNDEKIESTRWQGATLLAHSIKTARAIQLCIRNGLTHPAFSLARVQYEAVLKGHIIIHEIEPEELSELSLQADRWIQNRQLERPTPSIKIQNGSWKCVGKGTIVRWRPFRSDAAKLYIEATGSMGLIHDLTHSGITLSSIVYSEYENPSYSEKNQTILLQFADQTVMFAATTWPGVVQKYQHDIEQRENRSYQMRSAWIHMLESDRLTDATKKA